MYYVISQITGTFPSVKNALLGISSFLLDPPSPSATTQVLIPSHYLPFLTYSDATHLSHIKQVWHLSLFVLLDNYISLQLPFFNMDTSPHLILISLCYLQISGANLTVEDPKPGQTTGKVIIFGTPQQTKTAQSLIHGLIFSGVFDPS